MKNAFALAVLMAAAPLVAQADDTVKYSYVEAGYFNADIDVTDGDGFQLRGSALVHKNVYLFGSYGSASADDADIDLTDSQFGGGFRWGVSPRADLLAEVSHVSQKVEVAGFSETYSGVRIGGGVRGRMAQSVEGWAKIGFTDGDFDSAVSGQLGVQYNFTPTWGAVFELEKGEAGQDELSEESNDYTKYLIGVRASF